MLGITGRKTIETVKVAFHITAQVSSGFREAARALSHGGRAVLTVLLRQIYFTGYQAIPVVSFLALIIGVIIIAQIIRFAGHGSEALTGRTLVWVVVRGAGPLLTAIIVVARSGTAISTELGSMQVSGEVDSLRFMGIDPDRYLFMPRLLGVAVSTVILTLFFEMMALLGGILVASLVWRIPFRVYGMGVVSSLTLLDIGASILKGSVFGLGIASICFRQGMGVGKKLTAVPQAATRAVMQSLFLVFVLDGLISLLLFF